MKKAFIIHFVPSARIVADVPEGFDPGNLTSKEDEEIYSRLVSSARGKMSGNIEGYLCNENVEGIFEDTEMPYDPEWDDKH